MAEITAEFIQGKIALGRKHCLVILRPGPNRNQDEAAASALQLDHLKHLFGLMAERKLVVNGPVVGAENISGISIYESGDRAEVEAMVRRDPAIIAGRLTYEIHEWFSIDGCGYPAP